MILGIIIGFLVAIVIFLAVLSAAFIVGRPRISQSLDKLEHIFESRTTIAQGKAEFIMPNRTEEIIKSKKDPKITDVLT